MSRFVLDCSISAAWFLEDETCEAAEEILLRLGGEEALVPSLWPYEMANVMTVAERKRRISAADAMRAAELLTALPISIEPTGVKDLNGLRLLAKEFHLSAYDAAYLELAQRSGLPLATLDTSLAAAAERGGVPLLCSLKRYN